jgi:hypothetical protein
MIERILQPSQIVVPGEYEVGNESILKIYHRIFDKGHGNDLPPVIVAKPLTVEEREGRYRAKLAREYASILRDGLGLDTRNLKWITPIYSVDDILSEDIPVNKIVSTLNSQLIYSNSWDAKHAPEKFLEMQKQYRNINNLSNGKYFLHDGNHRSLAAALTHNQIKTLELEDDKDLDNIRNMVDQGELFNYSYVIRDRTKSLFSLKEEFEEYLWNNPDKCLTVEDRTKRLVKNKDIPQYIITKYLASLKDKQ